MAARSLHVPVRSQEHVISRDYEVEHPWSAQPFLVNPEGNRRMCDAGGRNAINE